MILVLSLGICNIKPGTCYSAKMCEVLKKKKKEKLNGDMSKGHRNQWKEFPMAEDRTILVKQINKVVLDYSQCKSE